MPKQAEIETRGMRLDKWLWCARFYKTRAIAADAIKAGKITLNGERAKPSRMVEPGASMIIKRGPYLYDIEILLLSKSRKSATEAMLLYQETQDSIKKREIVSAQLKLDAMNTPRIDGRPTKRNRRQIIRFKTGN